MYVGKDFSLFYRLSLHAMNCSLSCEEAFESHPVPLVSSQHYFLKDLSPFQNVLAWTYHLKLFVCFLWAVWKVKILSEVLLFVYEKLLTLVLWFFFYFIDMIAYQCFLVKSWDPFSIGHIIWKLWWLNFFIFFSQPLYSSGHPAAVKTASTISLRGAWAKALPTRAGLIPQYPGGNRKEPTLWFTPTAQRMHAHTDPTLMSASHHRLTNAT